MGDSNFRLPFQGGLGRRRRTNKTWPVSRFGFLRSGLDPGFLFQTMQSRVRRALLDLQHFARDLVKSVWLSPTRVWVRAESVFRIKRSSVPWTRSFGLAILWLSTTVIVDCQGVPILAGLWHGVQFESRNEESAKSPAAPDHADDLLVYDNIANGRGSGKHFATASEA